MIPALHPREWKAIWSVQNRCFTRAGLQGHLLCGSEVVVRSLWPLPEAFGPQAGKQYLLSARSAPRMGFPGRHRVLIHGPSYGQHKTKLTVSLIRAATHR